MKRPDRLLLQDTLEAIDEVLGATPPEESTFHADKFIQSHVVRNIQIIGEAVSRLSAELREQHREIPWRTIAGMRHAIVHDYYQIDWDEVFRTATTDIPPLRQQIGSILDEMESDS